MGEYVLLKFKPLFHSLVTKATNTLFIVSMSVVLLSGGRYVFLVGEVVNLLFIWIAILQYQNVRGLLQ